MAHLKGSHEVFVYYEDTDALGSVYHANYLKFFERAREHLIGLERLRNLNQQGIFIVVHKIELICRAPARHGDTLRIETELHYSPSPRIRVHQRAIRKGACLVEGNFQLAVINREGRPIRLGSPLRS